MGCTKTIQPRECYGCAHERHDEDDWHWCVMKKKMFSNQHCETFTPKPVKQAQQGREG